MFNNIELNQVYILSGLVGMVISMAVGFFIAKFSDQLRINHYLRKKQNILRQAEKEAATLLREEILESKKKFQEEREEISEELFSMEERIHLSERRIAQKEKILEQQLLELKKKQDEATKIKQEVKEKEKTLNSIREKIINKLEEKSGLSAIEALKIITHQIESRSRMENQKWLRRFEESIRRNSTIRAKEIIGTVLQRWTASHSEYKPPPIKIKPSMKGKIVGKEGRNIKEFELLTDTEVNIDEKENTIVIQSDDPVKKEIARMAMQSLIDDGRIYPKRIAEIVKSSQKKMENIIREEGYKAASALGLDEFTDDQLKILGRLKYRTSFGQNILNHSVETAMIAALLAAEIRANRDVAKRGGLLHDIGKSVDHAVEGGHSVIGIELARMFNQSQAVIHAIAGHHEDEKPETVEAYLVLVADAISASRPGARMESMDNYLERIKELESLAEQEHGIEKSYAIQAGRELRVYVHNDELNDKETISLAERLKNKIQENLTYPGEIKVTVIRETRAVEYAR